MMIPCKDIATVIKTSLKQRVKEYSTTNKRIKLVAFLLGNEPAQLSFVSIKRRLAAELGIDFEFIHYTTIPPKSTFLEILTEKAEESKTTGILIQHPLPADFSYEEIYNHIPKGKDIEGHRTDSRFHFPLTLSVLTGLKYIYQIEFHEKISENIIVEFDRDRTFFQEVLRNKKIVIAGRGITGGKPIKELFEKMDIAVTQTHSETKNAVKIYKKADIIITATGKEIITPAVIKKGVILLNVGLRKENGKLKGDYDEEKIKNITSFYTQTPGGLGPLDVLYLYKNLIEAVHTI